MGKTKKCHYISQVYLKQWSHNDNHLNIYRVKDMKVDDNGISIDNNFIETNLYNYPFDLLTYVKEFPSIYNDFKKMIKNFEIDNKIKIYYKDRRFNYKKMNLGYLNDKADVSFYESGKKVSKRKENYYYDIISHFKSTYLEEKLSTVIENEWNNFLQTLYNKVNDNPDTIELNENDDLLLRIMFTTMIIRVPNVPGNTTITNTKNNVFDFFYMLLNKMNPCLKEEFNNLIYNDCDRLFFLKNIYDVVKNNNYQKYMFPYGEIALNFELYYITDQKREFYTCDVPCFEFINNYERTNQNNGYYFPLTPKMVLVAKRDESLNRTIACFDADNKKVNYINNLVCNMACEYIIFLNTYN